MRQSQYHESRSVAHFVSRTLPDSPSVLKVAPTGTAASYIDGHIAHCFSFSFDGKPLSLAEKARDQRREALKNLRMVSCI